LEGQNECGREILSVEFVKSTKHQSSTSSAREMIIFELLSFSSFQIEADSLQDSELDDLVASFRHNSFFRVGKLWLTTVVSMSLNERINLFSDTAASLKTNILLIIDHTK
jgi:hypothetical protein